MFKLFVILFTIKLYARNDIFKTHAFIEIVNESNCKLNKLWVDEGKEFYNSLIHIWLDDTMIFQ